MDTLVIATIKSWNLENATLFSEQNKDLYRTVIISNKDELTKTFLDKIKPRYIFFPHWSWIIPTDIYQNFECIVFHMTDLPYGRGGSPLQNLIINKIYKTKISALQVVKELDGGPIYLKNNINIETGNAQEIFCSISKKIFSEMIPYILKNNPTPQQQKGTGVQFFRRKPHHSNLLETKAETIRDCYDFIRMLDGEGYPQAFIDLDGCKITFSNVLKKNGKLEGTFEISEKQKK